VHHLRLTRRPGERIVLISPGGEQTWFKPVPAHCGQYVGVLMPTEETPHQVFIEVNLDSGTRFVLDIWSPTSVMILREELLPVISPHSAPNL
jgi:hypothetical protein